MFFDLLVFIVSCRQVCLNYHHIHRIGFYLHHHNSISESIYFCYSLIYFGLCNNCNSSLTCWTARVHYSVPITNKISSIPPSYLTAIHNTQPISPYFLFNILQLTHRIHRPHIPCPYSYFVLFFHPSLTFSVHLPLSFPTQCNSLRRMSILTALAQLLHQLCLKR